MREKLEARMLKRISAMRGDVFLDFANLGGYGPVGRVLCKLWMQASFPHGA